KFKTGPGEPVRYVEEGGRHRVMTEDYLGTLSSKRWGRLLGNLLLNAVHFAVWFFCLWLLVRFQWTHALGLAFVLWLALTIVIMPMLFRSAEDAARKKAMGQTAEKAYVLAKMCMMSPSWTMYVLPSSR